MHCNALRCAAGLGSEQRENKHVASSPPREESRVEEQHQNHGHYNLVTTETQTTIASGHRFLWRVKEAMFSD